jgi:CHASE3 domain sensor protein
MKKRLFIIVTAFCISFVSMIALSLFSLERFNTYVEYSNQMDHTSFLIINIRTAEIGLRDIDRTERGYMITRDTMFLRLLNNSVDSINKTIRILDTMTRDNPEQKKNITMLKASLAIRIAAARDNIAYVDSANTSAPSKYYYDSREQMKVCSKTLRAMHTAEQKLLKEKYEGELFYQKLSTKTLKYLLFIFCTVTFMLFAIMIKELRSRVRFQEELQAKVIDLKRSHNELQEIAYAA